MACSLFSFLFLDRHVELNLIHKFKYLSFSFINYLSSSFSCSFFNCLTFFLSFFFFCFPKLWNEIFSVYSFCKKVLLHFTDKIRFERARCVVPLEAFAVPIPKLEAVLFFAILVAEVVGFARIPVCECDWATIGHPEEVAFVSQVRA